MSASIEIQSPRTILRISENSATLLIGTNGKAHVRIDPAADYRIKPRRFGELRGLIDKSFDGVRPIDQAFDEAYSGAESDTLPNITVLRSWPASDGRVILGQTFGHEQFDPCGSPNDVLEVYECVSEYAALLSDLEGRDGWELYVMKPGDKVPTFDRSIMTLFCLGTKPAVLLDVANPVRHQANKRIQEQCGSAVVMHCDARHLHVRINSNYVNRSDGYGIVGSIPAHDLILPLPDDDRPDRLYRALISPRAQRMLASRGICVVRPDIEEIADFIDVDPRELGESLSGLRKDRFGPLRDYLFREDPPAADPVSSEGGMLMFGPAGDLGRSRVQSAVADVVPDQVDCAEIVGPPEIGSMPEIETKETSAEDLASAA